MCEEKFNITGYHGTTDHNAKKILDNGFRVKEVKNRIPNHWLGQGIYFYNLEELARYWGMTKSRSILKKYGHDCKEAVFKADMLSDKNLVLDLDDNKDVEKFAKYYQTISAHSKDGKLFRFDATKNIDPKKIENGDIALEIERRTRCFVLDLMKNQYNYAIIMATFEKSSPGYTRCEAALGINYKEKQICVTENKYIVNYKLLTY